MMPPVGKFQSWGIFHKLYRLTYAALQGLNLFEFSFCILSENMGRLLRYGATTAVYPPA